MLSWQFIVYVLAQHWMFDYVLQSDKMACGKSTSFKWLAIHSALYGVMAFTLNLPIDAAVPFYTYLFLTHGIVDGITSRITAYLYVKQQRHWFFVVIGLDAVIHYLTIFWWLSHMR